MPLFKILGFAMIIFTTAAIGFSKSAELFRRCDKLGFVCKGVRTLKEHIRLHGGETDRLIEKSFGKYPIDYTYLENGDVKLLEEFFAQLGMSDTTAEYERCELYVTLLEERLAEAQKKYRELGKLYKSVGVMAGIFICIFFI